MEQYETAGFATIVMCWAIWATYFAEILSSHGAVNICIQLFSFELKKRKEELRILGDT